MSKSQPNKSKSPSRPTWPQLDENSSPLIIQQLQQLTNSVDLKRRQLNNVYEDLNHLQTKETAGNYNILKHVHFESIDTTTLDTTANTSTNPSRNASPPKFSQTYTVHSLSTVVKTNTIANKNQENKTATPTGKLKPTTSKVTKIPQIATGSNVVSPVEKKQPSSVLKSPLKQTTNKINSIRPVLTFQQKRQLEIERKAKFEQDLLVIRQKVILRKFGYLWLRLFFYARKIAQRPLLLPSQTE
jgi:hypothetical protein